MSRSDLTWLLFWLLWLAFVIAIALFPAWRVIPAATIVLALAWQASRTMTARNRAGVGPSCGCSDGSSRTPRTS
jgi:hypothetical protein